MSKKFYLISVYINIYIYYLIKLHIILNTNYILIFALNQYWERSLALSPGKRVGSAPPDPARSGYESNIQKKNYPHDPLRVVQDIRTRPALIKRVKRVTRPNQKIFFCQNHKKWLINIIEVLSLNNIYEFKFQ